MEGLGRTGYAARPRRGFHSLALCKLECVSLSMREMCHSAYLWLRSASAQRNLKSFHNCLCAHENYDSWLQGLEHTRRMSFPALLQHRLRVLVVFSGA
jgi:hypothetical protein